MDTITNPVADLIGSFEPLVSLDDHERVMLEAVAGQVTREQLGDLTDLIQAVYNAGRARGPR